MSEASKPTDQEYIKSLLDKYNKDNKTPELNQFTKSLLGKIVALEKDISNLSQEYIKLSNTIRECKEKMETINQQVILKKGQSSGLVESLLVMNDDTKE